MGNEGEKERGLCKLVLGLGITIQWVVLYIFVCVCLHTHTHFNMTTLRAYSCGEETIFMAYIMVKDLMEKFHMQTR